VLEAGPLFPTDRSISVDQAEPLVTCLKDLFQTVVELKKEKEKENAKNENNALTIVATEIKDVVS